DRGFRRISTNSALISELDRENVTATIHLPKQFLLNLGHQNLLAPVLEGNSGTRAKMNQAGFSGRFATVAFSTSLFESESQGVRNLGFQASARRDIGRMLNVGLDYFHSKTEKFKAIDSLTGRFQERLIRHLSLIQYATHSAGQTSFNFGG